ncbi:MAG: prepilin-type N-terminal cleavage/methylation domain-containing protein [Planctomycetia bacterium]|jgi:hypothetical protein
MNKIIRKRKDRRGITIIEMLAAMTVGLLVAAVGIGLIVQLLSVNAKGERQNNRQRAFVRLAETFREDAHRAHDAKLEKADGKSRSITFRQDGDRTVRYEFCDGRVDRNVTTGGKPTASDTFPFGRDTVFEISVDTVEGKQLAMFRLKSIAMKQVYRDAPPIVAGIGTSPGAMELSLPPEKEETNRTEAPSEEEETPGEEEAVS